MTKRVTRLANGTLDYKRIPLLSYLTEEEFGKMTSDFEILHFKKGDSIFRAQDPAEKMYIIIDGFMKVTLNLSDGREQLLYIYRAGDFLGGLNLLSGDRYVYNASALWDMEVITVSKEDFQKVLLKNNQFLIQVLEKSYERIRRAESLISRLSVINTDVKVAKLLFNLIKIYGKSVEEGILLDLNITQEELGSFTGLTRETMSRKLKQFEEMGMVRMISRGKILITNIKKLSEYNI